MPTVHQNKFSESRTHIAIAFVIHYSTPAVAADISEQTGISKKMGGGGWHRNQLTLRGTWDQSKHQTDAVLIHGEKSNTLYKKYVHSLDQNIFFCMCSPTTLKSTARFMWHKLKTTGKINQNVNVLFPNNAFVLGDILTYLSTTVKGSVMK